MNAAHVEDALNITDVRLRNRYCKSDLAIFERTPMQPGVGMQHETEVHVNAEPVMTQVQAN